MKRIFPNVYSKVLKGKSQSATTWYPGSVCAGTTRVPTSTSHRVLSVSPVSPSSPSSPVSASQSPGPLAPRRHRLAAPPLSSPCTPHLTSPSPGNHGPPPSLPSQPHTPGNTSHIVPISPSIPPKAKSSDKGELQLWCDVTLRQGSQTPPGMSTVVTGATATNPGHGDTHNTATGHNKRMGTQCRFPSCYFIHFAAKIAEVSQLADKTWGWWLLLGPGVCGVGVLPPPSAAAAGEQRNFSSRPAAEWTQSRGGRAAVRTWRRGAPARGTTMISQHVFTGPRGNDGHCCFV